MQSDINRCIVLCGGGAGGGCGDCDAFLISRRRIAPISDAITALSRSHHQQWGQDDSSRKESIKVKESSLRTLLHIPQGTRGAKRVKSLSPHMAAAVHTFVKVTTYGCCTFVKAFKTL